MFLMELEEFGYIVHKLDDRNVYVLGNKKFTPLQLSLKKEQNIEFCEKVYFGNEHREKVENIVKWISENEFLNVSKLIALEAIEKIITENKDYYINFINENIPKEEYKNLIQRALCIGPKTFEKIKKAQCEKPFECFNDLENRAGTKVLIKNIAEKIYDEISGKDRFRIFSNKAKHLQ